MSTTNKPKTRITGIKSQYKYWKWLQEHLNQDKPDLDYFSFAELVSKSKPQSDDHCLESQFHVQTAKYTTANSVQARLSV
ncbi:hypothetical protein PS15m_007413 [Mucor circinelloides]